MRREIIINVVLCLIKDCILRANICYDVHDVWQTLRKIDIKIF